MRYAVYMILYVYQGRKFLERKSPSYFPIVIDYFNLILLFFVVNVSVYTLSETGIFGLPINHFMIL